ncbi:beta-ketoacyl synthase N-terminal-like domain-containing protein [Mesorhizobium sp.]|uniref:beta-ketoacyl synthase N-terminal-like domain-containing protein n=1 Tax=Mesorhizobium sp. TaxID=1871066 RepID=UPI000FE50C29|nr:beta-ketoacyl synthase N-terminal-like domain-containing protein [Mesorhizobium sp.]RWO43353.1 MAG: 3-oxoacyl-ACP synthase [Mesorhizobium sp.]TIN28090.1 MAG: 3-oxoacyl-ACP synthase [Mesorhizobium sp.]TIN33693.1 MAG: 3-oxoacyl-ACP synthase [Mesorhizobium sp.]TJU76992.1 MAG: 3-oxoacyl-ACP synthase [Mesorhizobium sp.]TJU84255.1 MAG: 3-oxoacyl-ACP synthase [Mesorhizobium sp.]
MSASLDIVSVGMVTAVGLDAPSSCAAMRARLDGFQETRFSAPGGWLVGAPVPLPRGWIGQKRLAHLLAAAIGEALDGTPDARDQSSVILCLPERDRVGSPVGDAAKLVAQVSRISETELAGRTKIVTHGRPSGHVALEQARRMLGSGAAKYVMIAGVDSYLTTGATAHYLSRRRLLTTGNPDGFIPGEAAGAVICVRSSGKGLQLLGLGLSREPGSIYNSADIPMRGDGMTSAYNTALQQTGIELNQLGYRIADLIGEQFWFKQSALANLRLLRGRHDFQDIWSPAESIGNIGAAVGPVMLGVAFTAALKGYAAGDPVLVEASNDDGGCAAAVFARREA